MTTLFKNNAASTLASSLATAATSMTVTTGHGDRFPVVASPDVAFVTLENAAGNIEIVKITTRTSGADSMTIVRAQEGTVARDWVAGDIVSMRITAASIQSALSEVREHVADTSAAHAASAISNTPSGNLAATTVQAALNELQSDVDGRQAALGYTPVNKAGDTMSGKLTVPSMDVSSEAPTIGLVDTNHSTRYVHCNDHNIGFLTSGWAWAFRADDSGNCIATGNVTAYSDPRLKENFEPVHDPLAIIGALDGGTFNWKHGFPNIEVKAGKRDYGLLADQVEAVMPEIVTDSVEMDGESYKTVAYEKLVPVLIEAIKAQQAQIDALKAKVEGL